MSRRNGNRADASNVLICAGLSAVATRRSPLADLVRQSVYRRLAGYEDVNDAERLSHDPTFRLIGSEQLWERGAALTSRVHSFETELLTQDKNLTGLAAINRELLAKVEAMEPSRRVVLDLDSTEIYSNG